MQDSDQKRLGIYYTPPWLARQLVSWAFEEGIGPVLDPSFGGCSLLRAALDHLTTRVGNRGSKLIYGFDVDHSARRYANDLFTLGVPRKNLVFENFLSSDPSERSYRAIVGNPPYVRHHRMSDEMIDQAQFAMREAGVSIPRMASSWAYFVVHSAQQLARGGRMALLLPGAVLHADYARPIVEYLCSRFASVRFVHVAERLFEGALEETVVLLARDFGGHCICEQHTCSVSTTRLMSMLRGGEADLISAEGSWKLPLISPRARAILRDVEDSGATRPLGDVADIRIGVVTGANSFFVRSADDDILSLAHASSVGVVATGACLAYPIWNTYDQRRLQGSGAASRLLMIGRALPRRSRLLSRVRAAEREGIHKGHWCSKRDPWYALTDNERPIMFLPYMGSRVHPMSLNRTLATCTNAVHRIWPHDRNSANSLVFSSWSSLHLLAGEIACRSYGGGIMKLEPGSAVGLPVLTVPCLDVERLNHIARTQGIEKARGFADNIVLRGLLGLSNRDITALRDAEVALARRRQKRVRRSASPAP